jgi:hypothetical protein
MPIKNKSVRPRKREQVVPFVGEENFVVPKQGGFGQPDMEDYVMVAGGSVVVADTPTGSTGGSTLETTTSTNIPITPAEQTGSVPPSTTSSTITPPETTTTTLPPLSTTATPEVSDTPSTAEADCIARGGAFINGQCILRAPTRTDAPIVDTLPNFPVWDSLDCTTLKTKIAEYNAILSTSRFSATVVDAYNTEIAKGNAVYNAKCNVPSTPPIAIIPTELVGRGGGFGGGGGGLGEEPVVQEPIKEEKKGMGGLLLLLGIVGVVYYLTRKSK